MNQLTKKYIVLTFAFSGILWLTAITLSFFNETAILLNIDFISEFILRGLNKTELLLVLISTIATLGPMIVSISLTKKYSAETIGSALFVSNFEIKLLFQVIIYFFIISGLPALFYVLTTPDYSMLNNKILWIISGFFIYQLLSSGLEEVGWRGFLLPRMLKNNNALNASVKVGLIWGLWHTPIVLYMFNAQGLEVQQIVFSFFGFIMGIIGMSIIHTHFFLKSRSMLLSILVHAIGNSVSLSFAYLFSEAMIIAVGSQLLLWISIIVLLNLNKKRFEEQGWDDLSKK